MQRTTEKCHMSADRFTTGKSTDRLIDNRLENRGRQIFASCTLIDERLDICLPANTPRQRVQWDRLLYNFWHIHFIRKHRSGSGMPSDTMNEPVPPVWKRRCFQRAANACKWRTRRDGKSKAHEEESRRAGDAGATAARRY